ncbi:YlcI/YnfO family protein [Vibrio sp. NH-UV-68]|uniref:YlcI/YnfO family protein n=1 Tax=unclassified Vibrio TaxID=2614977 RepID=UPI0036F2980B
METVVVVLNSNTNRKSAKKNIRFDHELLHAIDQVKPENMTFSQWVKAACWDRVHASSHPTPKVCTPEDVALISGVRTVANNDDNCPDNSLKELVYALYQKGLYFQQIANKLNQLGIPSIEGKTWSRGAVKKLVDSML